MSVRAVLASMLFAGAVALSACGSGAQPYPPTGVDELVIPTPSPRASDYVATIDNTWLPLEPGRTWTYDVRRTGYRDAVRTVQVLPDRVEIAGIATTVVSTRTVRPGEQPATWSDYYAQDTRGNVWWLGRAGLWQAGRDGAQAGLAMSAEPRLGDGYRTAYVKGVLEDVVTVARVKPDLALESSSALSPGSEQLDTYRAGVGLIDGLDSGTGEHEVLRD